MTGKELLEETALDFQFSHSQDPSEAHCAFAIDLRRYSHVRMCNELRKFGAFISSNGIRSIWVRQRLTCFKDCLRALENKVAREEIMLTEAQVVALEKKKRDDEAETEKATFDRPIW